MRLLNYFFDPPNLSVIKFNLNPVGMDWRRRKYLLNLAPRKSACPLIFCQFNHNGNTWLNIFSARSFHYIVIIIRFSE